MLTDEEFKNPSPLKNDTAAPTIAPYFEAAKETKATTKDEDDEEEKIITESISSPSGKRTLLDDYTFENLSRARPTSLQRLPATR